MNNKLAIAVKGNQQFMNREIPVVLGGFGPDAKCVSDKTIAEIHEQPEREIRRRITDNIKRFRENVDYIDLAQRVGESHTFELLRNLGYSKQAITQAEHIYILSERGYAKLIKIMDTDLAWEIHDRLIDEYFELREGRKQTAKPIPLSSANNTAKIIMQAMGEANVDPVFKVLTLQGIYEPFGIAIPPQALPQMDKLYDLTAIARELGVMSKSGKPHSQAIGVIVGKVNVRDSEVKIVPFMNNGHSGTTEQYTESVVNKIAAWLEQHDYPTALSFDGKAYTVRYKGRRAE